MKAKDCFNLTYLKALEKWLLEQEWTLMQPHETEWLRARKSKGIFIVLKTKDEKLGCIKEHHGKVIRKYIQTLQKEKKDEK